MSAAIRRPWEERKLEAQALEEAAASARWTALPKPSETLEHAVVRYEGLLIAAALSFTHGKLVEAAEMLGMTYQALAYSIKVRHPELLGLRSKVYPRRSSKERWF